MELVKFLQVLDTAKEGIFPFFWPKPSFDSSRRIMLLQEDVT